MKTKYENWFATLDDTQCLKSTQKGNIGPKMNFKSGKNGFDL